MNYSLSSYLRISVIFMVVTLILNYLVPRVFGYVPVVYCNDQLNVLGPEYCRNTNLWLGNLQLYLQYLGLVFFALLLGIILAVKRARDKMSKNRPQHLWNSILALVFFWVILASVDYFFFRPLVMMRTPTGVLYNRFELNTVYSMTVGLVPLAISTAGFILTEVIMRKRTHLLGSQA